MRELPLFSALEQPLPPPQETRSEEISSREEKGTEKLAKDFVKWCFSFGPDFRNSPDITNLRFWAQKNSLKLKSREEDAILEETRPLYLKRIEQLAKKTQTDPMDG